MPAPVPVTIRHDSPAQLGSLARAAGASAFNRQNRLRNYETRLRERLADQQFLNAAANRQLQDAMDRRRVTASLDRGAGQGRMLQEARRYSQPTGVQTFTRGQAEPQARPGQVPTQPDSAESLVPAPAFGQPQQQPLIVTRQAGEIPFGPAGNIPEQVRLSRLEQDRQRQERPMVTPDAASQLQSLAAMRGQIPEDQFNALWTLAQSGQLKGSQLIDDIRQSIPGESGRMTATERMLDRNEARRLELQRVAQLPPDQQVAWAEAETQSSLGMTPESARAYIQGQLQLTAPYEQPGTQTPQQERAYNDLVSAFQQGGDQNGPIRVNSPEEAAQLPSGTLFITPDGRRMRKR